MDNRIAYGLAKRYGIDTSNMSPRKVWQALKKKGVNIRIIERVRQKKEERARSFRAKKFFHDDGENITQVSLSPREKFYGKEYTGYKEGAAIDKLLKEKQGHIKKAFFHKEIGFIDLVWGDNAAGMAHVIKRREELLTKGKGKISGIDMVKKIPEIIKNGKLVPDNQGRFNVEFNGYRVGIKKNFDNDQVTWIVSAMEILK